MAWNFECDASRSWLIDGLDDYRQEHAVNLGENRSPVPKSENKNKRFDSLYEATVSGDINDARKICRELEADRLLHAGILAIIERLEADWYSDRIPVHKVADAFWTLRRILDERRNPNPLKEYGIFGKALIAVRKGEEHSFGAQLLTDRLERRSWDVELLLDAADRDVLDRIQKERFNVVGFSVANDHNLLGLADLIADLRLKSSAKKVRVFAGGCAFQDPLEQYDFLGADAICNNGDTALKFFSQLGGQLV